jgi:DNA-binding transcriptional ArsR family regulator
MTKSIHVVATAERLKCMRALCDHCIETVPYTQVSAAVRCSGARIMIYKCHLSRQIGGMTQSASGYTMTSANERGVTVKLYTL